VHELLTGHCSLVLELERGTRPVQRLPDPVRERVGLVFVVVLLVLVLFLLFLLLCLDSGLRRGLQGLGSLQEESLRLGGLLGRHVQLLLPRDGLLGQELLEGGPGEGRPGGGEGRLEGGGDGRLEDGGGGEEGGGSRLLPERLLRRLESALLHRKRTVSARQGLLLAGQQLAWVDLPEGARVGSPDVALERLQGLGRGTALDGAKAAAVVFSAHGLEGGACLVAPVLVQLLLLGGADRVRARRAPLDGEDGEAVADFERPRAHAEAPARGGQWLLLLLLLFDVVVVLLLVGVLVVAAAVAAGFRRVHRVTDGAWGLLLRLQFLLLGALVVPDAVPE